MKERRHNIAVLRGDGIGPEVIDAALSVLNALMRKNPDLKLEFASADVGDPAYEKYGSPLPEESLKVARESKAVLFGAAGRFATEVLRMRQIFDLFANVRPAYTFDGVPALQRKVDFVVVRENTEDVYKGVGYSIDDETFVSLRIFTKRGMERITRYAFELARRLGRKSVLLAHKAVVVIHTDLPFLNCFKEISREYPGIEARDMLVDSCAMRMIMNPEMFDVILASNQMGDILSDVSAGIIGGLGFAPSGNIGEKLAMFEPVHGSAPDLAGKHQANPIGAILAGGMMLEWLGEKESACRIHQAVSAVLKEGRVKTFDIGGSSTTEDMTGEIIKHL